MNKDRPAAMFKREGFELRMAPWIAEHLAKQHLQRPGRILDVGCGDGILTSEVGKLLAPSQVIQTYGLDRDRYSELKPQFFTRLPPGDFLKCKPGGLFRYILMTEYLEHVADPQKHLRKARSLLEPDGRLVVQCPNAYSINRVLGLKAGVIDHLFELTEADLKAGHRRFYNLETLRDEIRNAGFVTTRWHTYFYKPFPNRVMELVMSQYDRSEVIMKGLYLMEPPGASGALVCVEGTPDPEASL